MDTHWRNCLIDFLKSLRSPATRVSYSTVLLRFFAEHADPRTVTKRDIEAFMRTRFPDPHREAQKELAASTQNLRVAALASFYKFAATYIPEHASEPLFRGTLPTLGITRGKAERSPRGLSFAQIEQLFSVIPLYTLIGIRDKAVLLLYFWTARRRSEISDLCYGDITETSFSDGHGGMRKAHVLAFRGKGHKSEIDHQEIPRPAMDAITWYLLASGRAETIRPDDPLFTAVGREPGKGGNVRPGEVRMLSAKGIANRIALYAKEAGLHASLHTLRHTSSRARFESGENLLSIQTLLRHSNLQTTYLYLQRLTGIEDSGYKLLDEKYRHL